MPAPMARQAAVPTASSGAGGYGGGAVGGNVQSWYDFARKPLDQGGLGLTHEQAAGKVANLQAESGKNIAPWGVTGDNGATAWSGRRSGAAIGSLPCRSDMRPIGASTTATPAQHGLQNVAAGIPGTGEQSLPGADGAPGRHGRPLATQAINRFYVSESADNDRRARGQRRQLRWRDCWGATDGDHSDVTDPADGGGVGRGRLRAIGATRQHLPEGAAGCGQQGGVCDVPADRRPAGADWFGRHEPGAARYQRAEPHGYAGDSRGLENRRADANLAINQAAAKRAAAEDENTPYQYKTNPDGTVTDVYAEAQARAKAGEGPIGKAREREKLLPRARY